MMRQEEKIDSRTYSESDTRSEGLGKPEGGRTWWLVVVGNKTVFRHEISAVNLADHHDAVLKARIEITSDRCHQSEQFLRHWDF